MTYDEYVNEQAKALGITPAQYKAIAPLQSDNAQGGGSVVSGGLNRNTLDLLNALKAFGGSGSTQSNQNQSASGNTVQQTGAGDPQNALSLLGAQALDAVGMNPSHTMTVNPTPGTGMGKDKGSFAKTGVSPVSGATTYDISGQPTPGDKSTPSIFNPATAKAPTATTKAQPAEQAGGAQMSQGAPFATAPTVQPMSTPVVPIAGIQSGIAPPVTGSSPFFPGGMPKENMPFRAMASGGIVDEPTLALIGENGPEMVTPLNKRRQASERPQVLNAPQAPAAPGPSTRPQEQSYYGPHPDDAKPMSSFHDMPEAIRPTGMYLPGGKIPYQPTSTVADWMTGSTVGPPAQSLGQLSSPTVADFMAGTAQSPPAQSLGKAPAAPGMSLATKASMAQGLMDMASKVGKPLQDYGANASWRPIANAIPAAPGPSEYTNRYPLVPRDQDRTQL